MSKADRGFASMPAEQQRQIASAGGKKAHANGTAHVWTRDEARVAGSKRRAPSLGQSERETARTGAPMKLTTEPPRDLSLPPSRFQVLCANPHCEVVVLYRGDFCKVCITQQATERARLQAQKDPK